MQWAARLHAPGGPLFRQYLSPLGSGASGALSAVRLDGKALGQNGASPRKRQKSAPAGAPKKAPTPIAEKWCWSRCKKDKGQCNRATCSMSHWCPSHWKEGAGAKVDHAACDCDAFDAGFAERAAKGLSRAPASA